MSVQTVIEYLNQFGAGDRVRQFEASSATVELAALAVGVAPQRIVKTLSFRDGESGQALLIAAAGDARIDNNKFKASFGFKARMLTPEEAIALTGHAVGGVCPFALPATTRLVLDVSIQRFDLVYPAAGSPNSAVGLSPDELFTFSKAVGWVDVCKDWA
ncbi:MAG TPA: YbaK/EbsC family protein [Anaerolineales bacterium]|nr:YbaK/EbsC family protein [Anaerolineales bacterium]